MRYAWVWLCWLVAVAGYRIRPYDTCADERRWFWQRHHCCQPFSIREREDYYREDLDW